MARGVEGVGVQLLVGSLHRGIIAAVICVARGKVEKEEDERSGNHVAKRESLPAAVPLQQWQYQWGGSQRCDITASFQPPASRPCDGGKHVDKKITMFFLLLSMMTTLFFALPALGDRASAMNELARLTQQTLPRRLAPTLNPALTTVRGTSQGTYTPTVLMHGLGDAGSNSGMQSLAQTIETAYPGAYAVAVNVANTLFSYVVPIRDQIEEFAAAIKADPKLANEPEVNLVGLSQGGLVVRGYAELYAGRPGYPKVKNLVSICGVQNGVFNCPLELQIIPFLCDVFETNPYDFLFNGSIPLSFSDYFVTYWNETLV